MTAFSAISRSTLSLTEALISGKTEEESAEPSLRVGPVGRWMGRERCEVIVERRRREDIRQRKGMAEMRHKYIICRRLWPDHAIGTLVTRVRSVDAK